MKVERIFVVALLFIAGCGSDDEDALAANRDKWESSKPESYVIHVCATGLSTRCVQTAVSLGKVVSVRERYWDQDWVERDPADAAEPVAELFDGAGGPDCGHLDVEFDRTYGFVSEYKCTGSTDWGGATVECFVPNTTDFAVCSTQG